MRGYNFRTVQGHSIREICEIVGISRNTYYKYTSSDSTTPSNA
ncbi:MAG: helix-turn-helix domain-containing protein [Chloroflexi bacterium]|nr:helix-turn-helix domain-containing protein [Chloroflexota bacterium]